MSQTWEELLEENMSSLDSVKEQGFDLTGKRDIQIRVTFRDRETVMNARAYVKSLGELPPETLLVAANTPPSMEQTDLKLVLFCVPDAKIITDAEWKMRQAAQKFGGEEQGWLIMPD